ncbi:hypothetical protein FNH13_12255 [Ornithinimicrobium ciconiae]|uniref:Uncharacterized protein n=1 Tax=Ornithinimicrobium ciconiae TaxID=2594265 RepID=A0A516GBW7_9MICO|nr:hypothetical protein [Ornithinimicrobium ciconiae]QDO88998.1 hypothetical protein FNH13_12255 [Ornithinimicrobium ciconiae]
MAWGKKSEGPPEAIREAGVPDGDKLIAAKVDELTGRWVLACRTRVTVVSDAGEVQESRPWLDVDGGTWDPEQDILRVTWIEGGTPTRWQFTGSGTHIFTDAFRDRVQSSVVLVREVDLGPGRKTRVAIRKDLATRELVDQVVPGRGVRSDDVELAEQVAVARATLRDQSGLPPLTA